VTLTPETIPESQITADSETLFEYIVPNFEQNDYIEALQEKLKRKEIEAAGIAKEVLKKSPAIQKSKHLLKNNKLHGELVEKLLFIEHSDSSSKYSYAIYVIQNVNNLKNEIEMKELTDLSIIMITNILNKDTIKDAVLEEGITTTYTFLNYLLMAVFKKQLSLLKTFQGAKKYIGVLMEHFGQYYTNSALKYLLGLLEKDYDCDLIELLDAFPVVIDTVNQEMVIKLANVECSPDIHLHILVHTHKWISIQGLNQISILKPVEEKISGDMKPIRVFTDDIKINPAQLVLQEERDLYLKAKTTPDKLKIMIEISQKIKNSSLSPTPGLDNFKKNITKVLDCLEKHFGGSIISFSEKTRKLMHTTYGKKVCNGKGEGCGISK
jgi:hypothetical protein